jgi:hypothetical protein
MAAPKMTAVALCRYCGRAYRVRVQGEPPPTWRGTREQWHDVLNEQQDFCPCQAKQIQPQEEPKSHQLTLF